MVLGCWLVVVVRVLCLCDLESDTARGSKSLTDLTLPFRSNGTVYGPDGRATAGPPGWGFGCGQIGYSCEKH